MKSLNAGRLNHRVAIQSVAETANAAGEPIQTWQTIATRWMAIEPLAGRELWAAKQTQATTSHKVTLRFVPGLTTKDRFNWSGRIFNIVSIVMPEEVLDYMQVMVEETLA